MVQGEGWGGGGCMAIGCLRVYVVCNVNWMKNIRRFACLLAVKFTSRGELLKKTLLFYGSLRMHTRYATTTYLRGAGVFAPTTYSVGIAVRRGPALFLSVGWNRTTHCSACTLPQPPAAPPDAKTKSSWVPILFSCDPSADAVPTGAAVLPMSSL